MQNTTTKCSTLKPRIESYKNKQYKSRDSPTWYRNKSWGWTGFMVSKTYFLVYLCRTKRANERMSKSTAIIFAILLVIDVRELTHDFGPINHELHAKAKGCIKSKSGTNSHTPWMWHRLRIYFQFEVICCIQVHHMLCFSSI